MCKYDQLKQLNFLVVYTIKLDSSVDGRQQNNNRSFKHDMEVCLRLFSSVCYYSYRAGAIPWLLSSIEIDIRRSRGFRIFVFVCDLEGATKFGFDYDRWSWRVFMLLNVTCRNNFTISTDFLFPVSTTFGLWIFLTTTNSMHYQV